MHNVHELWLDGWRLTTFIIAAAAAGLTVHMKIDANVNSVAIYARDRLPMKLIRRHDIDGLYVEQSLYRIAANDIHTFDLNTAIQNIRQKRRESREHRTPGANLNCCKSKTVYYSAQQSQWHNKI